MCSFTALLWLALWRPSGNLRERRREGGGWSVAGAELLQWLQHQLQAWLQVSGLGLSGSPGWLDNSISSYLVCSGSAQCSGVRTRLSKVDRISAFQGENIQCSSALESYAAAAAGMQSQCKVCLSRSFCTDWDQRQESLNLNKCIAALYFTPDFYMYKFFYFKRIIIDSLLLYYPKHLITYYLVFTSSIKGSVILQNERHYYPFYCFILFLGSYNVCCPYHNLDNFHIRAVPRIQRFSRPKL